MRKAGRELIKVTAGGIRWQVLPEWRHLLLGSQGLRLHEWLRDGLAHIVKNGPHRTVYRIALPGLSFYLKHYRLSGVRAWLRQLVRPAKARLEFERALAVAERRVPTVVPIALGEGSKGPGPSDSFLITRGLDKAEPVSSFIENTLAGFEAARRTRVRQRLAAALGEFVAQLHLAGVVHHDFHPANLLVRIDGDDLRVHLIDLDAVRLGRPLTWRASRDNLVILNRWFMVRASRSDRLRFWLAYCRARSCFPGAWARPARLPTTPASRRNAIRETGRDLERRTLESNWHFWRKRDRRCLVSNRYYTRCRSAVAGGYAVRDLDADSLRRLLADPDAPFVEPCKKLLKDSPSSTVAEFALPVNGVLCPVIYKRFRIKSWTDPWRALLRQTPAVRSWIYGHGLRERLLPTARPLAVFQRRRGLLSYEGYLVTEKIMDARDLHDYLAHVSTLSAAGRQGLLRTRIDQVAQLVRSLHERRLSQRDLKAVNILLTDKAAWLIDLVGVASHRRLSRARRLQNLARLHASFHDSRLLTRTDKLRFLRAYLRWGLFGRQGWKDWWRAVHKSTQAKVARNARTGRPLA